MKKFISLFIISYSLFTAILLLQSCSEKNNKQDELTFQYKPRTTNIMNSTQFDFEGYTDHWDKYSWSWDTYAGIFDESNSNTESDLWQMEMTQGNKLILKELWIQPGFVYDLHHTGYTRLNISQSQISNLKSQKGIL